jgi:hypothetical protein
VGGQDAGRQAADAKIAMLDLATNQPTVDYLRDQGFMQGFGIDVKDENKYGDEDDPRICGHEMTGGAEDGGRTAMETLSRSARTSTSSTRSTSLPRRALGSAQGCRQGRRQRARRVDRWRLPGRAERQGRASSAHVAAIPAENGSLAMEANLRVHQERTSLSETPNSVPRHRRYPHHDKPVEGVGSIHHGRRPLEALLGLISAGGG